MTLNPFEYFTIVRQIEDPLDTETYYPQAEIRNARTDALLSTVDLESKGDGRYSERWQVPADTSGLGFYISIITKVYTDAGHTEETTNYGRKEQTFLVKERAEIRVGGSGPSANDIREILKKVLSEFDFPTGKKVNLKPLIKAIKAVPLQTAQRIEFPEITIPEQKEVTLTPIINAIETSHQVVLTAIKNIKIPKYEESFRVIQELMRTIDVNLSKAEIDKAIKLLPELNAEIAKIPEYMQKVEQSQQLLKDNLMTVRGLFGAPEQKLDKSTIPSRLRSTFNKIQR